MRKCTGCNEWKENSDFYARRSDCKECKKKKSKDRYAPIKQLLKNNRESFYDGDTKLCKSCHLWKHVAEYSSHPDHWDKLSHSCKQCVNQESRHKYRIAETKRARRNGDRQDYQRQWYQKNKDAKRERNSFWRKINKEKSKAIWHRYRARKKKAGGDFTSSQWLILLNHYSPDGACLCCGEKRRLHADHVVPLYAGGGNYISNIQPLCKTCNSKKGGSATIDYRPDKGDFALELVKEHA